MKEWIKKSAIQLATWTSVTHLPVHLKGAPVAVVTLTAYGYMADLARQAQIKLAYDYEIFTELITPTLLSPFELSSVLDSVKRTGRLLTIEEGTRTLGWGAEVSARVAEAIPGLSCMRRLAAQDTPSG